MLSGATTVGLAISFSQARKRKFISLYLLWVGFLGSLGGLGYIYWDFVQLSFQSGAQINFSVLALRTLVGIPLGWLAWFCQTNISESNKSREDYLHKESLMRLYDGFNNRLQEDGMGERAGELLDAVFHAVAQNPVRLYAKDMSETSLVKQVVESPKKIGKEIKDLVSKTTKPD